MATVLTSAGVTINGTSLSSAAKSLTYATAVNSSRQGIGQQSGSSFNAMWNPVSFSKKTSSSTILVQGQCIGMDAYSYPYGATAIRLRHSDGTDYRKYAGSQYTHNGDGAQTVYWKINVYFTGSDLGNKTGTFNVYWEYGDRNGGGGNKPWETQWNWNSNEDGRAQQQGSTCTILEVG